MVFFISNLPYLAAHQSSKAHSESNHFSPLKVLQVFLCRWIKLSHVTYKGTLCCPKLLPVVYSLLALVTNVHFWQSYLFNKFNGWELLPFFFFAAPLQSCAKVLSGRGHLLLWTALLCYSGLDLVPGHYSSNNVYFAVQAKLAPLTSCHVQKPLIWWVHLVGGFYLSLASTFPAQDSLLNGLMLLSCTII